MEFLAANDQENQVHGFQTAAAGKQLNQGLKGFAAKTPRNKAPKTPFKIPLNDENAPFRGGKSVLKTNGKGNQDLLVGNGKGADLDKNAFITPAGPRARAPLGMKTTNAKTKAFQTPAPLTDSTKTQKKTSPRLRRPKVKVHQAESVNDEAAGEEPEIEYMPPKCIPLANDPEGWPSDMKFPMFEGANFTRGMESTYFNPVGDDGLTRDERKHIADKTKSDKRDEEMMQKAMDADLAAVQASIAEGLLKQKKESKLAVRKPLVSKAPSTVKSRTAAAALSPKPKSNFAAPAAAATAATKSRDPSKLNLMSSKKPNPTLNPSAARHAAATTASRSTIGYSHARNTSTSLRKPLTSITKNIPSTTAISASVASSTKPSTHKRTLSTVSSTSSRPLSRSSSGATVTPARFAKENFTYEAEEELMREMQFKGLEEDDDDDINEWLNSFAPSGGLGEDDEFENFQLTIGEF